MKLYKLTDADDKTRKNTQWGAGVTHTASGTGELCSEGWIHAYEHPLLAVLHNPIHGNFDLETAHLWECETSDKKPFREGQMKLGVRKLTTVRRIDVPVVTLEQRIRYGIFCSLAVYGEARYRTWATAWLDGTDRTERAATEAEEAEMAAEKATRAVERAAARANKNMNLIALAEKAMEITTMKKGGD